MNNLQSMLDFRLGKLSSTAFPFFWFDKKAQHSILPKKREKDSLSCSDKLDNFSASSHELSAGTGWMRNKIFIVPDKNARKFLPNNIFLWITMRSMNVENNWAIKVFLLLYVVWLLSITMRAKKSSLRLAKSSTAVAVVCMSASRARLWFVGEMMEMKKVLSMSKVSRSLPMLTSFLRNESYLERKLMRTTTRGAGSLSEITLSDTLSTEK